MGEDGLYNHAKRMSSGDYWFGMIWRHFESTTMPDTATKLASGFVTIGIGLRPISRHTWLATRNLTGAVQGRFDREHLAAEELWKNSTEPKTFAGSMKWSTGYKK